MSRMNAERRPTKKGSSFPWYAAAAWERIPRLIHGFSGRLSDQAAALSGLSATELPLHTLTQVHGNALRVVGPDTSVEGRPPGGRHVERRSRPAAGHCHRRLRACPDGCAPAARRCRPARRLAGYGQRHLWACHPGAENRLGCVSRRPVGRLGAVHWRLLLRGWPRHRRKPVPTGGDARSAGLATRRKRINISACIG